MVPDETSPVCDVCETGGATAGGLGCGHRFCGECFSRYVAGSVLELHTALRCSVCGHIGRLVEPLPPTPQTLPEVDALVAYGRDGDTKLWQPCGFALHATGNVIVVDKLAKRVKIFTESGRYRHDFAYVFNTVPTKGVCVTSEGQIAIASRDSRYQSVNYFTIDGAFCGSVYIQSPSGCADIQSVTCDVERDLLYVTDRQDSCIHVINNITKLQINRLDLLPQRHETQPEPRGVAVDASGDLYVADAANSCVRRYSRTGQLQGTIGSQGERPLQFNTPTGVAVTSQGDLVVADRGNQRVQLLTPDGEFLRHVVCFKAGYDVYMAPDDVFVSTNGEFSVLMTSTQAAHVGEIRVYR